MVNRQYYHARFVHVPFHGGSRSVADVIVFFCFCLLAQAWFALNACLFECKLLACYRLDNIAIDIPKGEMILQANCLCIDPMICSEYFLLNKITLSIYLAINSDYSRLLTPNFNATKYILIKTCT